MIKYAAHTKNVQTSLTLLILKKWGLFSPKYIKECMRKRNAICMANGFQEIILKIGSINYQRIGFSKM